jgi:leucine dehydrogenase
MAAPGTTFVPFERTSGSRPGSNVSGVSIPFGVSFLEEVRLSVFDSIHYDDHEEVVFAGDPNSGLRAIIAIHSTALGPALGGTRLFPYPSEEDALSDVLRLSRGMSLKAAASGLDLGGGKAVIIGDPKTVKSERLWRAYGQFVESLGGRYITAEDVGTTTADMELIRRETRWSFGTPLSEGGSGDPSPSTARGLIAALRAVAMRLRGDRELAGLRVAIQGVGKVGYAYAGLLTEARAEVIVADIDEPAAERAVRDLGVKAVPFEEILGVDCDVLSPCALGGGINADTIPQLSCSAILGSANNQLETDEDANRLAELGILYAPDFVVNAGGLINVSQELRGYTEAGANHRIDAIEQATLTILDLADRDDMTPNRAAISVAETRIREVGGLRRFRPAETSH